MHSFRCRDFYATTCLLWFQCFLYLDSFRRRNKTTGEWIEHGKGIQSPVAVESDNSIWNIKRDRSDQIRVEIESNSLECGLFPLREQDISVENSIDFPVCLLEHDLDFHLQTPTSPSRLLYIFLQYISFKCKLKDDHHVMEKTGERAKSESDGNLLGIRKRRLTRGERQHQGHNRTLTEPQQNERVWVIPSSLSTCVSGRVSASLCVWRTHFKIPDFKGQMKWEFRERDYRSKWLHRPQ